MSIDIFSSRPENVEKATQFRPNAGGFLKNRILLHLKRLRLLPELN